MQNLNSEQLPEDVEPNDPTVDPEMEAFQILAKSAQDTGDALRAQAYATLALLRTIKSLKGEVHQVREELKRTRTAKK